MQGKSSAADRVEVCVVSSHPLVVRQVGHALSGARFRLRARRIDSSALQDDTNSSDTALYVLDGELPQPIAEGLVASITQQDPVARTLVVAERFPDASTFGLLRLGVKGLVRYQDFDQELPRAVDAIVDGGFWAPRSLLSRFLDELVLQQSPGHSVAGPSGALSRRQEEVLHWVTEGLANKEIASRLHISERTVKFHVSNLLAKFKFKSRRELIRHCLLTVSKGQC